MSAVAELINQLCPNGVEYKKLGEVCVIKNGKDYKEFGAGPYPVYGSGGIMTYVDRYAYDKPSVLIPRKGSIENLFYVDSPFWNVDTIFYTEVKDQVVVPKYLYCSLQAVDLKRLNNAGGVPSLTQTGLYTIEIPVPPLPIQQEIVRRLDAMTGLIEDLEKELAARQKQYDWVREETFRQLEAEGVERKKLGEICTYSTRRIGVSHVTAKTFVSVENMLQERRGRMDAVSVPTVGNVISFEVGDVLIGNIRPYLKKIWCADTSGGTNGDVLVIQRKDSESILSRYLYQVLSSDDFFRYDMKYSKGAKMPRGDKVAVMKYLVPVPPLPAQQQIVRRLDEMTELIAVIEKEIALRKQQYEYCRERLLTFSRAG